jgi:starvation-inducible DNA-binding protein
MSDRVSPRGDHMTRRFDDDLADELQAQLRDLLCLAVVGDHFRWVVKGDEASELVDWLFEATPQWRGWAEQVARELVRLGVAPDARVRSLAKDIPLNWVPDGWLGADEARRLVASRLGVVAGWARVRRSLATDPNSVQVLDAVCVGLEAQARERPATVSSAVPGLEHQRAVDTEGDEGKRSA